MQKFLKEYIKNPKYIGAIVPSSKFLAKNMIESIDFNKSKCIVEYGPGTGVFTKELVSKASKETLIVLIEHNNDFAQILNDKYKSNNNVIIINDSAEFIDYYLNKYNINTVDYIISGLPFASLPQNVSTCILDKTKNILSKQGKFITFQYTLFKKDLFKSRFRIIQHRKVFKNIPPAYVIECSND